MIISTRPVSSQPLDLRLQEIAASVLRWPWPQPTPQIPEVFRSASEAGPWYIFDPVTHEEMVLESEADARACLDHHWRQQESHLAQMLQVLMIRATSTIEPPAAP